MMSSSDESAGDPQPGSQPSPGAIPPSFGAPVAGPPADPDWHPPSAQPEPDGGSAPGWYPNMSPGSSAAGPFAAPSGRPLNRLNRLNRWSRRGRLVNVLVFGCAPLVLVGVVVAAFVLVSPGKGAAAADGGFHAGPAPTTQKSAASAVASSASPSTSPAKAKHHRRLTKASPSAAKLTAGPKPTSTKKAKPKPKPTQSSGSGQAPPQDLGAPNFDGYCSSIGDRTAEVTADNAYGWHCTRDTAQVLQISDVCGWTYGLSPNLVVGVSTNYYDANAWQCWRIHRDLGVLNVSAYCTAAGLGTAKLVADDAYGWECTGSSAPVDTTAGCDTVYHVSDAISRFAVFADPYSWQCWD
jgi:hypothetical protein